MARVAREPFALTLWTYQQLLERRRILALLDQQRALEGANLTAMAFHEPKRLGDAQEELLQAMRRSPDAHATAARAESLARRLRRAHLRSLRPHG